MGRGGNNNLVGNLPLSQALCLPVSAEEIIDTCDMIQVPPDDVEQVSDKEILLKSSLKVHT